MNAPKVTKEDLIKEVESVERCILETSKFLEENTFTKDEIIEIKRIKNIINSIKSYDKINSKEKFLKDLKIKRDTLNTTINRMKDGEIYSPL